MNFRKSWSRESKDESHRHDRFDGAAAATDRKGADLDDEDDEEDEDEDDNDDDDDDDDDDDATFEECVAPTRTLVPVPPEIRFAAAETDDAAAPPSAGATTLSSRISQDQPVGPNK